MIDDRTTSIYDLHFESSFPPNERALFPRPSRSKSQVGPKGIWDWEAISNECPSEAIMVPIDNAPRVIRAEPIGGRVGVGDPMSLQVPNLIYVCVYRWNKT